ncbi:MAG: hypothetical protein JSR44_13905 [Spirochaetes bacterium]|nr:hypothetical protein [Spirochaetota bacterium]
MKMFSGMLVILLVIACKKNPHISKSEIEKLTGLKVEKILLQKKYQLDDSASFEDVALFEAEQKTRLAIFTPTEKNYQLLRQTAWPHIIVDPKVFFIATGNKRSQVLVTHGAEQKLVDLFDARQFSQQFTAANSDTKSVKITKNDEKPNDEFLTLGAVTYRFNGLAWIQWTRDEIFPFVDVFNVVGNESMIEIVNRGQFGTRVIVTLAFPEIMAADLPNRLKLTKNIATVRLYKPGFPAHKKGGGNVALQHPLIEIQKDAWGKNGRLRLPLFMQDIKKITLRAVYSQRGHNAEWPSTTGVGVVADGQGYPAVEKNL